MTVLLMLAPATPAAAATPVVAPRAPALQAIPRIHGPDLPRSDRARGLYARVGKRALDLGVTALVLIPALPLLLLLALALWVEGTRPFEGQARLGRGGRSFRLWRLRADPKASRLGRFLRATALDELPVLLNVLRGEMSLVGPRPLQPGQLDGYLHPDSYAALRPGLTGLWQLAARREDGLALRAVLDHAYLERLSLAQDLAILRAAASGHR